MKLKVVDYVGCSRSMLSAWSGVVLPSLFVTCQGYNTRYKTIAVPDESNYNFSLFPFIYILVVVVVAHILVVVQSCNTVELESKCSKPVSQPSWLVSQSAI